MEVRVMQRGDRGLFVDDNNKFLFPDRSWKDAKEGFVYDIEITVDKGTYAFFKGKMLNTLPIGVEDIDINFERTVSYSKGAISGQEYIMQWDSAIRVNNGWTVYVKTDWGESTSLERVHFPPRCNRVLDYLMRPAEPLDVAEALAAACPVLNFEDDEQYAFEMFKLLRVVYKRDFTIRRVETELRVYNSSIVIGKHSYRFAGESYDVYRYYGEVGKGYWGIISGYSQESAKGLFEKASDLGMDELMDFVREYKVCVAWNDYIGRTFDERLTSHSFEALGSGVVVYAFNMNGYGPEWFQTEEAQPYIALVEESFERLDYLKKRMGKMHVPLEKLTGLNVMEWLAPFKY